MNIKSKLLLVSHWLLRRQSKTQGSRIMSLVPGFGIHGSKAGRQFPPTKQVKGMQFGTSLLGQSWQCRSSYQYFVPLPSLACAAPPYHCTIIFLCAQRTSTLFFLLTDLVFPFLSRIYLMLGVRVSFFNKWT